ncbi:carboxylesterase family protein [Streptomyces actinomycinicus]|uniref:Carboxylic ester hydrolase n=1 Tax=Streptomyces actinomycinicus TaxID=1695166 RepID=A0A937EF67_9ACTN|nr:carboxylesterase family protein [Streptomyces actinomycinicus]MBL1081858.1 carboxylesterase family protein [Streptomyces actinomycinicus]
MTTSESPAPDTDGPVVRTASGAVRGLREQGLSVFRGIPFAGPPVGEARFRAPRPVRPWDGVREAYAFGPPPPQDLGVQGGTVTGPAGDDWLTVNVWTPEADPSAGRPVMVWIYGGSYKMGHAGQPSYDAQAIARDGDVVVVTLNYRVGVEGFLRLDGVPANRGLLDQVAALEWVQENIAAFGGDPGRVTVFGESAGAGSVASLLAMPRARGLFRRAVAQSMPGTFFSDELARDMAAVLAAEAGRRPTAADLAAVDPGLLVAAGQAVSAKMPQYTGRWGQAAPTVTPYAPVVDGDVLPTTPWQALAAGAAREVDLVVGHNRDEFRLFMAMGGMLGRITDERLMGTLRLLAPGGEAGERAYRAAFPDASPSDLFERVQTDWLFAMPSLHLAEAQQEGGGTAHVYELTWPAPGSGGVLGACHALDVALLFGTYGAVLGGLLFAGAETPDGARDLSAFFRRAWTSFAHTGDPGWPAYDTEARLVQVLDAQPRVTAYPEERSRRLWQGHAFLPLPLLP